MQSTAIDLERQRLLLANAIAHWKLVFGITATRPSIEYLSLFSFGAHSAGGSELSLQPHEEKAAFSALEHTATFLCVNQGHAVLEKLSHLNSDTAVHSAFHIARLLRNSFAHDPFEPKWLFGSTLDNTVLELPSVIRIDTTGLRGLPVVRAHYGGPLAILRLTQFVDSLVAAQPSAT